MLESSHLAKTAVSALPVTIPYVKLSGVILGTVGIPGLIYFFKEQLFHKFPWSFRVAWTLSFLCNVIFVSIPGRFDGVADADINIGWETVFAPAGYAFAIWGMIYLGELLITLYTGLYGIPDHPLRDATIWWTFGNIFQSLWCAAFRPQFKSFLWLPSSLLGLAAISLFKVHDVLTNSILDSSQSLWTKIGLTAFRAPVSLHAGWLAAATLLNLNGWAAMSQISMGSQVALAFGSSYIAFILGLFIAIRQRDPLVALTVAWALGAIAYQTKEKSKLNLSAETKEALVKTEGFLAKVLVSAALGIPVVLKCF